VSIPTHDQVIAILREFEPPEWLLNHSSAVAEVASFMAHALVERGVAIDTDLVEAAALLHDIGKTPGGEHAAEMARRLDHAARGGQWLREHGHGELAAAVRQHPVTVLGQAPSYEAWAAGAGLAGRIVAYADKRASQDLVSLDERFADWYARHGKSELLDTALERARRLENELCQAAGIAPADVARRPWVAEALRRAA
jgi:putative nucleotidyltransferase with HDIG domain